MTPLEETLGEVLSDFGIRELPPEWNPNGDTTLVDGIALVVKATGNEYCKVANKDGKTSVVKDYGRCAAILRIEKIFAVNTISKFNIPQFKSKDEVIHFLCKSVYDRAEVEALLSTDNKSPEQIKADRSEIKRRIDELLIGYANRKNAERKRVDEIKQYAEAAKAEKEKSKTNGRRKKEKKSE